MAKSNCNIITPFRMLCLNNFPFIEEDFDAIDNYQLLSKIGGKLTEVIKNENNLNENFTNLYNAYLALKAYVDEYFDNLDIQEEINAKLDEMAENGTLADIIAEYIELRGQLVYNTVAEMKDAENITAGSFLKTYGFYEYNDGGGALYRARPVTNEDTVDEMLLIALNDVSLVAELIMNGSISPEQLGCYNDEVHDDGLYIQKCIDLSKNLGIKVNFEKSIYYISTAIDLPLEFSIDFQGITLKAISTNFAKGMINSENTWNLHNGVISNLKLDQNNKAPKGLYLYWCYRRTFENIDIKNTPTSGYGIYISPDHGGGGNQFNNITGTGNYLNSTFIYVGVNDNVFSHVDFQQYTVGIEVNGFTRLFDVHGYVASVDEPAEDWYTGSIFIKINQNGRIMADELYPDTHNFSFYNYSVLSSQIGKIFFTYNENTDQNGVTSVMFKANNDNVELYYKWRVESLLLSISNNVLFELIKNSTESTLSSYLHLTSLTGSSNITVDKPPVFVNRILPMNNFTKLGIYDSTLIAIGASQYASTSAEREICKTDLHSGYKLIDGYYPYKGINPTDSSIFDGTVKVENNIVSVLPNAQQVTNFQFFIQVPAQESNIASA